MSALKLVIFDVDGTLIDSQDTIVAGLTAAFASVGRGAPSRREMLSIVGLSLPEAFAMLAPSANGVENKTMVEAYKASYIRARDQKRVPAPLYPGALDALDQLAAMNDVVLGVATGKSRRGLDVVLGQHGLGDHFQTLQAADHHPSKPHPAMVLAAMREAGIDPSQTVMIGDTTYDVQMARDAGVAAIGVGWGYHAAADLQGAGATRVLDGFDDLLPALHGFWDAGHG